MHTRRLALGALLITALGACAQGGGPQPATTSSPTATVTPATQAPIPSPPPPTPMNPAPEAMLGKWTTTFAEDDVATLTIKPTGIRITRFASADVRLQVLGGELILSHSQLCAGEGRYRWTLEGDTLHFEAIEEPCDGRLKTFDGVTYTRVPG